MEMTHELIAQNEAVANEPETPGPAPDQAEQVARIAAALTPVGSRQPVGARHASPSQEPAGDGSDGNPLLPAARAVHAPPLRPTEPNDAPSKPSNTGSGDDVPPPSAEESGDESASRQASQEQPEAGVGKTSAKHRTLTQAEADARLAAQRVKLQGEHARQIRELELKVEAARLAPSLGISMETEGLDVVLANLDRKALTYTEGGKPANLAEVMAGAVEKIAAAVGAPRNLSSGLASSPAGSADAARSIEDFPRLGTPGLFKR